ncbi:MAG: DNA topoisomerase (ATP-hydrolyzing) [Clostridia bacterium]|nr:DNA topoisomerase (ATP-hydrolyzing) [Clostridia bacterium]
MAKKSKDMPTLLETIIQRRMEEVMHQSMMPYAEHVILERALPRVEDGLKPVQRRILFAMLELGLSPDKPHRKSARIVGDCLGKYHPHGDSSVYDAMVRMAQPFNMRLPLVDGHGNFGSIDGDSAAAMRYTEARMTPAAMQLLRDIDRDTVPFMWNFDDTVKEPELLPGRFPNLLINGASGIAVGLATNIPPHNPQEAIDAVIAMMDNPRITIKELMQYLPAPDFPTGGYILQSDQLAQAYETGRGKLTMRARTHFEELKNGKTLIVITELPYQVNKAAALEKILAITQEKKALFSAVSDIRDESDRSGMRAVIEIRKDGDPERILQYLFKYSDLQCTFGVNFVAIANGKPQQLNLRQVIGHYIRHQREVVTKRTQNELEVAEKREHILAGLMVAVDNVDLVIKLIRSSKNPKEARERLMQRFSLSEIQAQAILDLRLQRLTNLEIITIEREYGQVVKRIAELKAILASDRKLVNLIKRELLEIRELFVQKRLTQIISKEDDIDVQVEEEQFVEDVTIAVCKDLKIRKLPSRQFNLSQIAADIPLYIVETRSNENLRLMTDKGFLLSLKVADIPETRATARATSLVSLLTLEKNENIVAAFNESGEGDYLFFTKNGMVKRSPAADYAVRAKRTAAIALKDKDELLKVVRAGSESILLVSEQGMSIRFEADAVPSMGRSAAGVHGIKLEPRDRLIFAEQTGDEGELLTISDKGFGKRSFLFDYELQGRNGKGVKTFDFKKNGSNGSKLVYVRTVREPLDFTLFQRHGAKIELNSEQVRIEPKNGKGSMLVAVVLDDDVIEGRP